jgi:hypothetical protein
MFYHFLYICSTLYTRLILFSLITQKVFGEKYKVLFSLVISYIFRLLPISFFPISLVFIIVFYLNVVLYI